MGFADTFASFVSPSYVSFNSGKFQPLATDPVVGGAADTFADGNILARAVGVETKAQKLGAIKALSKQDFIDIGNSFGDDKLTGRDFAVWLDKHKSEALTNPAMLPKLQAALIIANSPDLLDQMDRDSGGGADGLFTADNAFAFAQRLT